MGCLNSKSQKTINNQEKYRSSQSQRNVLPIKKQYDPNFNNGKLWEQLLQVQSLRIQIIRDFGGIPQHPCFKQIQKDISRTFPNQEYFISTQHQQEFRIVLKNYAINFPKVGYTQGLNFVAGYFLLNKLKAQRASKCFIQISRHPELMCMGLYEDNFPLCYLYCELFWKVLEDLHPKIANKITSFSIPNQVWIFQWFLTFFIYSFPLEYIQQFFSFIFKQKKFAMVRIAVAIISCLKSQIKKINEDDDSYYQFTQCLDLLKHYDECLRKLNITIVLNYAKNTVTENLIQRHLIKIGQQKTIDNFYLKYFLAQKSQQKQMYSQVIYQLQQNKNQLSKSKNSQSLRNSYRRPRESVEIIDSILYRSLQRTHDRRCKSNLDSFLENNNNKNVIFKQSIDIIDPYHKQKWKSQANLGSYQQNIIVRDIQNTNKLKNFKNMASKSNSYRNFTIKQTISEDDSNSQNEQPNNKKHLIKDDDSTNDNVRNSLVKKYNLQGRTINNKLVTNQIEEKLARI